MTHDEFAAAVASVQPVDMSRAAEAQAHLDDLTKPKGSLGRLEEMALRLFLIQESAPLSAGPARICTVAGDHGVAEEGVSLFPQEVTRQMVLNFLAGGAGINVLANTAGIDLRVVDAGACGGPFDPHPMLIDLKVAEGTGNIARGPAMSEEQCLEALGAGITLADQAFSEGYKALGTGDMGIANTTPSTALYCAYFGLEPEDITGPGTGLDKDGVKRKAEVIRQALKTNAEAVSSGDPLRILAAVGGLEIACLAGMIIGGARRRMAVCVDGFISTAAYSAALRLCPPVQDYCFLSHSSAEPGYAAVAAELKQKPLLDLDFRLGEGTGAALALFLLRSAAAVYNDMATFSGAGVAKGE